MAQVDESACSACPTNSISPAGSDAASDCVCNAGFTSSNEDACESCIAGKYKTGTGNAACTDCGAGKYSSATGQESEGTCTDCTANSNSPAGSDAASDCTCNAGFTGPVAGECSCGDGLRNLLEGCDDGNVLNDDGCSAECTVECGYTCGYQDPSVCQSSCGDGFVVGVEECDDGNPESGDGCSDCAVEEGFNCRNIACGPSTCVWLTGNEVCGDGKKLGAEVGIPNFCDDGNTMAGDGCSSTCTVECGFNCGDAVPSNCASTCGDGRKASDEACDDGNVAQFDGCGADCSMIEDNWLCRHAACGQSVCAFGSPKFTTKKIGQSNPLALGENVITVTLVTNVKLFHSSVVTISGLTNAKPAGGMSYVTLKNVANDGANLFSDGESQRRGVWSAGTLTLLVAPGQTMIYNTTYIFSFQITNPSAAQNAATVNIAASGTVSITSATMTSDAADIYGVIDGQRPMNVIVPSFSLKTIEQSTPVADTQVTLSVTLTANCNFPAGSTVTIHGLTGSQTSTASLAVLSTSDLMGASGAWTQSTGKLVLTVANGGISLGTVCMIAFNLQHAASESPAPSISVGATIRDGDTTLGSIALTSMTYPNSPLYGVYNGKNPLEVIKPEFMIKEIGQSNPLASGANVISVTLVTNIDLVQSSVVTISGITNAEVAAGMSYVNLTDVTSDVLGEGYGGMSGYWDEGMYGYGDVLGAGYGGMSGFMGAGMYGYGDVLGEGAGYGGMSGYMGAGMYGYMSGGMSGGMGGEGGPGDECNPGCPNIWIGDGICDLACQNEACSDDGTDCDGGGGGGQYDIEDQCAPGCPNIWIGDGICDLACQNEACSYDGSDCDEGGGGDEWSPWWVDGANLFSDGETPRRGAWSSGTLMLTVHVGQTMTAFTEYIFSFQVTNPSAAQFGAAVSIAASGTVPVTQTAMTSPNMELFGVANGANPLVVVCGLGTYTSTAVDMKCVPCTAGKYSASIGALEGMCQECSQGTYSAVVGAISADVCHPCAKGKYSTTFGASSVTACQNCIAGKYLSTEGNDDESDCIVCLSGSFSSQLGATSISTCVLCPAGKYSADVAAASENNCRDCDSGKYLPTQGNRASSDCLWCEAGKSSSQKGAKNSSTCEDCVAGKYSTAGNELCTLCPPGTYSTVSGAPSISSCNLCPAGKYSEDTGASSKDVCQDCDAGKYSSTQGNHAASACVPCGAGKYSPISGIISVSACVDCPPGRFSQATSTATCELCSPGFSLCLLLSSRNS